MNAPFADRVIEAVRRFGSPLCVGLDPFADKIPALFGDARADIAAILRFGEALIDAASKHTAILKPQLGLFEPYGAEGFAAAATLTAYAQARGMIVILDAKRGDIGSTAEGYARACLGPAPGFGADAVTVSPYLGLDTIEPFLALAEQRAKGVAVLVRTSNPGAGDVQDLEAGGAPVWRRLAEKLAPLAGRLAGASGWSGLMAVAGATYPGEARLLRAVLPNSLFLVPGYGAQGASAAAAMAGFVPGKAGLEGGVVSSSRAIAYPPQAQRAAILPDWRLAVEAALAASVTELQSACAS